MPQRTISPAGGNWNATSSWVEGLVPGSADFVVGNSASGNLTFNIANVIIQYIDLTDYTATFNHGTGVINLNLNLGTSSFGSAASFTWSAGSRWNLGSVGNPAVRLIQYGTQSIGNLSTTSNAVNNILSDLYVNDYLTNAPTTRINGAKNLFINGTIGPVTAGNCHTIIGNATYSLIGSGTITVNMGQQAQMEISGSYSTFRFLCEIDNRNSIFHVKPTHTGSLSFRITDVTPAQNTTMTLKTESKLNRLFIDTYPSNSTFNQFNIDLVGTTLVADSISSFPVNRNYTSDNILKDWRFLNGGLSASQVYILPNVRVDSGSTTLTYRTPNVRLEPGYTHSVNQFFISGNPSDKYSINSLQAGTQATINLTGTQSAVAETNFTDINVIGNTLYAWDATLSNTSGISTNLPSGGTGSTASVGPYAFGFLS